MNSYVTFITIFFIFFLTGCQQETVTGPVAAVNDSFISIDRPASNTAGDVGTFYEIVTTNSTVIEDSNGNKLMLQDIAAGDKVKVVLANQESTENHSESGEPKASRIVLLESSG